MKNWEKQSSIKISIKDMQKLGVSWLAYCDKTGANVYSLREGLDDESIVDCPISLINN